MERDHYAVLGIDRDASQADIKAAYRERALECHPDRAAEDQKVAAKDEFLRVREAFDVLSDPQKRAAYDRNGREESGPPSGTPASTQGSRSQTFKEQWREKRSQRVRVRRSVFDHIDGLWVDREVVDRRTSVAVPAFACAGFLLFLAEPNFIYATDIFLVDLALCTLLGGAHGYVMGFAWAYVDLAWSRHSESNRER